MVLLGFHRVASSLLWEIKQTRSDLLKDILVVDFNVALHGAIAATGARVTYGDISNYEMLEHVGVAQARVIVCTIPDDVLKGTTNLELTQVLRALNPKAKLIVNAVSFEDVAGMYASGADYVFLSRVETAHNLLPAIGAALGNTLPEHRKREEATHGAPDARAEVLP